MAKFQLIREIRKSGFNLDICWAKICPVPVEPFNSSVHALGKFTDWFWCLDLLRGRQLVFKANAL